MANVLAPFGFTPVRRMDGAAWTGNMTQYQIAAANTNHFYQGDVVMMAAGVTGFIDKIAPGTTQILGIFIGCEYLSSSQNRRIWSNQFPGSDTTTIVTAYVVDDPQCVFLAQTAGTSGAALTRATLQANINFNIAVSGNNLNGISGMTVDDNTAGTTATLPFRVLGIPGLTDIPAGQPYLAPPANGYDQTTPFNLVLVGFNFQYGRSTTGI